MSRAPKIFLIVAFLGLAALAVFYFVSKFYINVVPSEITPSIPVAKALKPGVEILVENLTIPWDIAFLPDNTLLVTERSGKLLHIDFKEGVKKIFEVDGVEHAGEGGLLGIALHPNFIKNKFVYLYMTTKDVGDLANRVMRYKFEDNKLSEPYTVVNAIPGSRFHDGGAISFGPDGYLYITTGDAGISRLAQDLNIRAGKILRMKDDGSNLEIWSYGHRNPQGLAWDVEGRLWSTEHGPSTGAWPNCCQDEINLIEKGKNYGWPDSVGDRVLGETKAPILHSGRDTWAPASALYLNGPDASVGTGSLFFGGLRGEALYEAVIRGEKIVELREHFKGEFGRIRAVSLGPDGFIYITTSNRDGRGIVSEGDDKIIRIDPAKL